MHVLRKWKIIYDAKFEKGSSIYINNKQLFLRDVVDERLMAVSEVLELNNIFYTWDDRGVQGIKCEAKREMLLW